MHGNEKGEGDVSRQRETGWEQREEKKKGRRKESHQGLGLVVVGNLRLWTKVSCQG